MESSEGDRNEQLSDALKHPIRRKILRLAIQTGEPISPPQATRTINEALARVSYHMRVLADHDIMTLAFTKPTQGALVEHFYSLEPAALPIVKAILKRCGPGND